jgi:sterol desaturase/sphingolipid hydroxylase (fatty acid hydroxylase superfamily)
MSQMEERTTRAGLVTVLTLMGAIVFVLIVRGGTIIVGVALLFLLFVPLEKLFSLRKQRVFRKGLLTDLTHFIVNNVFVTIGAVALVVVAAIPYYWIRNLNLQSYLPTSAAIALAVALVFVGNYWGHRLTHTVPQLWRFHSVHHSIEQMDWVAAGRLHPFDSAFTQAFTIMPLFVLGYGGGVFAGVAVFVTLLAIFQHANVRLRFPFVRWIIPTPEWHHWHHAIDDEARDKNFGLPVVDKIFGTAYMPNGKRPVGFGTHDPVPPEGYFRHLAYPFRTQRPPELAVGWGVSRAGGRSATRPGRRRDRR